MQSAKGTPGVNKEVGHCYTGDGDKTGPEFKVDGKSFLADLNFLGCLDGKQVEWIVFVREAWTNAPKNLRRLWPVEIFPKKKSAAYLNNKFSTLWT